MGRAKEGGTEEYYQKTWGSGLGLQFKINHTGSSITSLPQTDEEQTGFGGDGDCMSVPMQSQVF